MKNTRNSKIKAALKADNVKFTIDGFVDHNGEPKIFRTCCDGESIRDDHWLGSQMNIDAERSTGRFLTLYAYDLLRNRTSSKIQYSHITILN